MIHHLHRSLNRQPDQHIDTIMGRRPNFVLRKFATVIEKRARSSVRTGALLQSRPHHCPPARGRWLVKEHAEWQKQIKTAIAMILGDRASNANLLAVFCYPTSMLTQTAQHSGLTLERFTNDDFDLSTVVGYQQAARRLRELRPNILWFLQGVDLILLCEKPIREILNKLQTWPRREK